MARPHVEFIEAFDVPERQVSEGAFAGAGERMLSRDEEGGDYTALMTLPAGWSGDVASERPVELFAIRGELEIDGQAMTPGCYAYVPSGSSRGRLQAKGDSTVLVMVEPVHAAEPDEPIEVIDQAELKYAHPGVASGSQNPDRAEGIVLKLLREDPETKDWTWVSATVPGWMTPKAEVHPTVEECLMLRGDILLGELGGMTAGSYFWRPGMVRHGPMYSREGGFFFFRTKGGSLQTTWEEVPGWEKLVRDYVAEAPFFAGPGG